MNGALIFNYYSEGPYRDANWVIWPEDYRILEQIPSCEFYYKYTLTLCEEV